jgi:hypothetical protein
MRDYKVGFMLSETSRATSAAESRFRVQAPNSSARDILVVALDEKSAKLGDMLAGQSWRGTQFADFHMPDTGANPQTWSATMERRGLDLLVMIGTVGENLQRSSQIGARSIALGTKVFGVLLAPDDTPVDAISAALLELRPWSRTLMLLSTADYLPGILHSLGA